MAIDFPNSPTVGQEFTAGTQTWRWDGVSWNVTGPTATGNYLLLEGGVVTGSLEVQQGLLVGGALGVTGPTTLSGKTTLGTAPVAASDAATKAYVDAQRDTRLTQAQGDARYLRLSGGTVAGALGVTGNLSTAGNLSVTGSGAITGQLALGQTATQPTHAASKAYVDAQRDTRLTEAQGDARYLALTGGAMTGPIAMQLNIISGLPLPTLRGHATSKQYVDGEIATRLTQTAADARYLRIDAGYATSQTIEGRVQVRGDVGGSVMQLYRADGGLLFNFRQDGVIAGAVVITATNQPTSDDHLTRRDYVTAQVATRLTQAQGDARYMNLTGGTMTGDISMGVNQIRGSAPTGPSSFANAQYVQDLVNTRLTQAAADGLYAARTLTLTAGDGLTGGGSLGGNRTFSMGNPGTITSTSTNSVSGTTHTHSIVPATIGILFSENGDVSVGAVINARNEDGPARSFGQNIAGAALRYAGENGGVSTASGTPGGGTWKCKGHAPVGYSTSWVRVS